MPVRVIRATPEGGVVEFDEEPGRQTYAWVQAAVNSPVEVSLVVKMPDESIVQVIVNRLSGDVDLSNASPDRLQYRPLAHYTVPICPAPNERRLERSDGETG